MSIKRASTSYTHPVFAQDTTSTVGAGYTGLLYNTATLTCYYKRELGTAAVAVTLATMTLGTWATGGFIQVSSANMPGAYDFGVPNAAIDGSDASKWVEFYFKGVSGVFIAPVRIDLEAVDRQDTVRFGLTALPNAAAEAAGGLYTRGSGAGQINQANNGQVDANSARLGGTTQTGRDIGASVLLSTGTGTGQLDFTSGVVKSNVTQLLGTAVATPDTAGYFKVTVKDGTGTGEIDTSSGGVKLMASGIPVGAFVANSITLAAFDPAATDNTQLRIDLRTDATKHLGTAQSGSTSSTIKLATTASAVDSVYVNDWVWIKTLTGLNQSRRITAYVGSTRVATITPNWDVTPDATSTYEVIPQAQVNAGSASDPLATAVPGAYSAGQAGYILGTNLNATVSSRASQTSVDTIDDFVDTEVAAILAAVVTEVADIKAKTDSLTFTVAGMVDSNVIDYKGATAPTLINGKFPATTAKLTGSPTTVTTTAIELVGGGATDLMYLFHRIDIISGAGAGQSRRVIFYDGTTKMATVDRAWSPTINGTSGFELYSDTELGIAAQGVAQAGGTNTITLEATYSASTQIYVGQVITLLAGTGAFQTRVIKSYVTGTKVATVDRDWAVLPASGSVYIVRDSGWNLTDLVALNGSMTAAALMALSAAAIAAGLTTATTLTTSTTSTDLTETTTNAYQNRSLIMKSGPNTGVAVAVTAYNGTTKTLTHEAFSAANTASNLFVIV